MAFCSKRVKLVSGKEGINHMLSHKVFLRDVVSEKKLCPPSAFAGLDVFQSGPELSTCMFGEYFSLCYRFRYPFSHWLAVVVRDNLHLLLDTLVFDRCYPM